MTRSMDIPNTLASDPARPRRSMLAACRVRARWARRKWAALHSDEGGATSLEWVLVLAAIALPSYFIILAALDALIAYYQMANTLLALPLP